MKLRGSSVSRKVSDMLTFSKEGRLKKEKEGKGKEWKEMK